MKRVFLFIIFALWLNDSPITAGDAGKVEMKCVPFRERFVSGDAIDVAIQIENKTDQALYYFNLELGRDFELAVRYDDGDPVALSAYGRALRDYGGFTHVRDYSLKPNEKGVMTLCLSRFYDFTKAGRYDVTIARNNLSREDHKIVKVQTTFVVNVDGPMPPEKKAKLREADEVIKQFEEKEGTLGTDGNKGTRD